MTTHVANSSVYIDLYCIASGPGGSREEGYIVGFNLSAEPFALHLFPFVLK